jgi:hypothetical protein
MTGMSGLTALTAGGTCRLYQGGFVVDIYYHAFFSGHNLFLTVLFVTRALKIKDQSAQRSSR